MLFDVCDGDVVDVAAALSEKRPARAKKDATGNTIGYGNDLQTRTLRFISKNNKPNAEQSRGAAALYKIIYGQRFDTSALDEALDYLEKKLVFAADGELEKLFSNSFRNMIVGADDELRAKVKAAQSRMVAQRIDAKDVDVKQLMEVAKKHVRANQDKPDKTLSVEAVTRVLNREAIAEIGSRDSYLNAAVSALVMRLPHDVYVQPDAFRALFAPSFQATPLKPGETIEANLYDKLDEKVEDAYADREKKRLAFEQELEAKKQEIRDSAARWRQRHAWRQGGGSNGGDGNGDSGEPDEPTPEDEPIPEIKVNDVTLIEKLEGAACAIVRANSGEPVIFNMNDSIHLFENGKMVAMDRNVIRDTLGACAIWYRTVMRKDGPVKVLVDPDNAVVDSLTSTVPTGVPKVMRIVTLPFFTKDGRLMQEPGYYEDEGVLFHRHNSIVIPKVPNIVSKELAFNRRDFILNEYLRDWPFASDSDKTHAFVALVQQICREFIDGLCPAYNIEASRPSAGKTLLARTINAVLTGTSTPATWHLNEGSEEVRKNLGSVLDSAPQVVLADNLDSNFKSALLESIITSDDIRIRILGRQKIGVYQNNFLLLLTSNNAEMRDDLLRRLVSCRLEPETSLVEGSLKQYQHPDIVKWVLENRAEIYHAILVCVKYWLDLGRPAGPNVKKDGFENWSYVGSGITHALGMKGFLENDKQQLIMGAMGSLDSELRVLVGLWHEKYGNGLAKKVLAKNLLSLCSDHEDKPLESVWSKQTTEQWRARDLAAFLRKHRGRVFGKLKLGVTDYGNNVGFYLEEIK